MDNVKHVDRTVDLKQGVWKLFAKNHLTDLKALFSSSKKPAKEIKNIEFGPATLIIDGEQVELKNIEAIQLNHELKGRAWNVVDVFMIISSPLAKSRFGIKDPKLVNFGTLNKNSWIGRQLVDEARARQVPVYEA